MEHECGERCCAKLQITISWRDGKQTLSILCAEHGYEEHMAMAKIQVILGEPWLEAEEKENIRYAPGGLRRTQ